MPNDMPGSGMFIQTNMGTPTVGLNQAATWGGSSMLPHTVVPLLPGQVLNTRGRGLQDASALSGQQGTLDIQLQLGALVVAAAATGSIAAVAGSRIVDEQATGLIHTVSGADLVDGETFTLNDGVNAVTVFEFDSNSSVTGGHVAVTFTAGDSATTVRNSVVSAINGVGAGLAITASNGGTDIVTLINDKGGAFGNQPILKSVLDTGFMTSGMSGGGETFTLNDGVNPPKIFEFDSDGTVTSGSVAVTFTAGDSATTVRNSVVSAINGVGAGLAITAAPSGSNLALLTNDASGAFGNQTIPETVLDPGFVVAGMSQGATATAQRTVCYLTDSLTSPTHYIAIRVDSSNRPFVQITDNLGTVIALVTPSSTALAAGQPVSIRMAWDAANVLDVASGRHVTLRVNRDFVNNADWATNPTANWTSFRPQFLILAGALGDADFDGMILALQASNIAIS